MNIHRLILGLLVILTFTLSFVTVHHVARAQTDTNRYAIVLNTRLNLLAPLPSSNGITLAESERNAWYFRTVAEDLLIRSWGVTDPQSTVSPGVRNILKEQIYREVEYLLRRMHNGRWWWSGSGRDGDPNTDRFVLYSFLDAIYRLKQDGHFEDDMDRWLAQLRPAVEFQYNQYGQRTGLDWGTQVAGSYPNMDAAYLLLIGIAGHLYDEPKYLDSAHEFVGALENHLFPDGAFNYHTDTNEVIGYHDLVVMLVARYWKVTGDESARDLLMKTVNYYPLTLGRLGVPESTSHAWWKQHQARGNPAPIEIIAGLTGDGQNKWLANLLWENVHPTSAYYAVDFYRTDIEPIDPGDQFIVVDRNINGARGRFGDFSWVATLGARQDGFAGAMVTDSSTSPPRAYGTFLFATPEVGLGLSGNLSSRAAFITDVTYPKDLITTDDFAALSVQYRPVDSSRTQQVTWDVTQSWLFLPTHVIGRLDMENTEDHQGRYVRMRLRTVPANSLTALSETNYISNALHLNLLHNNFPVVRYGRGEVHDYTAPTPPNADELFLEEPSLTERPWRHYSKGTSYTVALETYPEWEESVQSFQLIDEGPLTGFGVTTDSKRYIVLFNKAEGEVDVAYSLSAEDIASVPSCCMADVLIQRSQASSSMKARMTEGFTIEAGSLSQHESIVIVLSNGDEK